MDDEVSDDMLKEVCITEQTQYYFESSQVTFRGNIGCENCTRYKKPQKTVHMHVASPHIHRCGDSFACTRHK